MNAIASEQTWLWRNWWLFREHFASLFSMLCVKYFGYLQIHRFKPLYGLLTRRCVSIRTVLIVTKAENLSLMWPYTFKWNPNHFVWGSYWFKPNLIFIKKIVNVKFVLRLWGFLIFFSIKSIYTSEYLLHLKIDRFMAKLFSF